ncbi:hypothetical protein D187_007493 [Cystobacter fuscus DSM 2262]|uniref:Uncharacterized protein n=1 Tax=Cystobacter fuscus (strain ATCC 25194 / DSM 2262 / NBRC 100088 / M29) TaxID=1242864 RepID=S9NZ79_CYSF2|nr:hypothetical protein [Cystobacter fuscus]EPX56151.1 hypothetical protein D187_007493 [Cystobacter fuscus DSM 2262]
MPIITTKKAGTCRACGGLVRKGEEADFSAEMGLSHVEPQCSSGPVRFRPNARAARCACDTWVKAGEGRLRLVSDAGAQGGGKRWAVDCPACVVR